MKTFLDDYVEGETDFKRNHERLKRIMERDQRLSEQEIKRERAKQLPAIMVSEKSMKMKKSTNWLKEMEWK